MQGVELSNSSCTHVANARRRMRSTNQGVARTGASFPVKRSVKAMSGRRAVETANDPSC